MEQTADTVQFANESSGILVHPASSPTEYAKTTQGILKIVQIFSSFLTFILAVSSFWPSNGWVCFASINGLILSVIWFVLHALNVIPQILANYYIEAIFYCFNTVFFLGSVIAAICWASWFPVAGAASFFSFVCLMVYGADAGRQVMDLWNQRRGRAVLEQTNSKTSSSLEINRVE